MRSATHGKPKPNARGARRARGGQRAGEPRRLVPYRCKCRANPCQRPQEKLQVVETTTKLFFRAGVDSATMRNHYDQDQALETKAKTPIVKDCEDSQVTKFVTPDRTSEQFPQVRCDRNCHPCDKICHHRDFKELGHKLVCPIVSQVCITTSEKSTGSGKCLNHKGF